jgi:hypothetical protein
MAEPVTGIIGTITGVISLIWQIARAVAANRQSLAIQPDKILLPSPEKIYEDSPIVLPPAGTLYVKCINTGRRPVVLHEVRAIDAVSKACLGRTPLRAQQAIKDNLGVTPSGLKLNADEIRVISIVLTDKSRVFEPSPESQGYVEVTTSLGKVFRSRHFFFQELIHKF